MRRIVVALTTLAAMAGPASAATPSDSARVIVKLSSAVVEAPDVLARQGRSTQAISSDFDRLSRRYGLRRARPLRTGDASISSVAGRRAREAQRRARIPRLVHPAVPLPSFASTYVLELAPGIDAEEAARAFAALDVVVYAEPDRVRGLLSLPNDPFLSTSGSWGQDFDDLWGLHLISAPAAWDVARGAGIVIAISDTGIDTTHPDLAANIWVNPGEIPGNGIDDDGNGYVDDIHGWNSAKDSPDVFDDHGHSSHVAGTAADVDISSWMDGSYFIRLLVEQTSGAVFEDRIRLLLNRVFLTAPSDETMYHAGEVVELRGTIAPSDLISYTLQYLVHPTPTDPSDFPSGGTWSDAGVTLTRGGLSPVYDGALATLDTSVFTKGTRLTLTFTIAKASGTTTRSILSIIVDPSLRAGWPVRLSEGNTYVEVTSAPTIVDLDGDGQLEILTTYDDHVYAFRPDGTDLPATSTATAARTSSPLRDLRVERRARPGRPERRPRPRHRHRQVREPEEGVRLGRLGPADPREVPAASIQGLPRP